jgi:hypothetical protein
MYDAREPSAVRAYYSIAKDSLWEAIAIAHHLKLLDMEQEALPCASCVSFTICQLSLVNRFRREGVDETGFANFSLRSLQEHLFMWAEAVYQLASRKYLQRKTGPSGTFAPLANHIPDISTTRRVTTDARGSGIFAVVKFLFFPSFSTAAYAAHLTATCDHARAAETAIAARHSLLTSSTTFRMRKASSAYELIVDEIYGPTRIRSGLDE